MKRFLILLFAFISHLAVFSQSAACDFNIPEICSNSSYPAAVTGTAYAPGGSFDCTGNTTSMNPAFFYLQAASTGPLNVNMDPVDITGSLLTNDLDFMCWGPFSSTVNMCDSLFSTNLQDCSYSAASSETSSINAIAGQYYIILVSNWTSGTADPCFIQFTPDSPLFGGGFAGDNNTINPCSTDPPFNLITGLNNGPDNNGFWINNSNNLVDSIFDPSIDTAGVYRYVIPGTTNCPGDTAWLTVNLVNGSNVSITSSPTSCDGDSPLTLTASPSGGTFSGTNVIGNLFTPDFSVLGNNIIQYVYQANGCSDTAIQTLTVFESPTVTASNITITNPLCFGEANGSAIIIASGGTPDASGNYSLNWFGMDPLALPAGFFNYEVTDINGCVFLDNVTLFNPQNTIGTLTPYNSYCYGTNNGAINITLIGGGGSTITDSVSLLSYCNSNPYATTSAQPSAIIEEVILNGDNNNINNNTTGVADFYEDYTASMYSDMTIGQPYSISITLNGIAASGNSLNNSGGKVFIDYNIDGDFIDPGEEIGVIPYRTTATVGVPEVINFTVPANAGTGATRMRVVSQYQSNPDPSAIGPCDAPAFGSWAQPWYGATEDYSIVLNTPSITADFVWNNGSTTLNATSDSITGLAPGEYIVIITPSTGCAVQDTATILEPEEITFNPTIIDISCNTFSDGEVVLAPTGGNGGPYNINWNGNNSTALADGSYTVTVTDPSTITLDNIVACFNDTTIVMVEPAYFSADFSVSDLSICSGDPLNLEIDFNSNGIAPFTINYTVNGPSYSEGPVNNLGIYTFTENPLISTTYSISSIVDDNGCINQNTINNIPVNVNPLPNMNISVNPNPICVGDNSALSLNGTIGIPPYNIDYTISDINGTTTATETVGSGGFTSSVSPIITTDYTLTSVTDDSTCVSPLSTVATLVVNEIPQLITTYSNEICEGDMVQIGLDFTAGTPPFNVDYTFNGTNTSTMVNSTTDELTLIATNPSNITINSITGVNCFKQVDENIQISVNPLPISNLSGDGSLCNDGSFIYIKFETVSGLALYDIVYTDGNDNFTLTNIGNIDSIPTSTIGAYTLVSVTDQKGCEAISLTGKANVNINPLPDVSIIAYPIITEITDPLINFIDKSTYLNSTPGIWDFGDGSGQISNFGQLDHMYADTGVYNVSLTTVSDSGCTNTAYQTIIINPTFTIYIPNAFTPNNDLDNDYFLPIVDGVKEYELSIYDRQGQRVFRTEEYTNEYCNSGCKSAWDGKINNSSDFGTIGIYVYHIVITDINGKLKSYEGTVTLIR